MPQVSSKILPASDRRSDRGFNANSGCGAMPSRLLTNGSEPVLQFNRTGEIFSTKRKKAQNCETNVFNYRNNLDLAGYASIEIGIARKHTFPAVQHIKHTLISSNKTNDHPSHPTLYKKLLPSTLISLHY